jgi:dienelactone hydrolase
VAETVAFHSEGVRLAGTVYRPEGAASGGWPGVVLCHGYNGVRDLYLPDAARALAAAGYVALSFDYKGWGGSAGPPLRLDPYGRVADAGAAVSFLAGLRGVDVRRIGLFGWSFGGSTAIWLAAHDRRVRVVASIVGVGDGARWMRSVRSATEWNELLACASRDRAARLATGRSATAPRESILRLDPDSLARSAASRQATAGAANEIPLEFIDETLAFRPEWIVDRLAPTPLLLVACERDAVVPAAESEALYRRAGEPRRLVVISDAGHYDVYAGPAFERTMAESLAWFGEHLA